MAPVLALLFAPTGCESTKVTAPPQDLASFTQTAQKLREGDVIKISFPSPPSLDAQQAIRTDGRITLAMLGEMRVVNMTPLELETELIKRYATQLVSNEVTVSVVSSSFSVFVSGAVNAPGKIQTDRPLTALEAILQVGGFTPLAKTTAVGIIRTENSATPENTPNLPKILDGEPGGEIYLVANHTGKGPQEFRWF